MQYSLCLNCGHNLQVAANYCDKCGAAAAKSLRYLMSAPRVALMTLLSAGLYTFWWFYITWKHYRDHTGEKAYPVWHALTLLVPIYNLYRVHAHVRSYVELFDMRNLSNSLSPFKAIVVVSIWFFLDKIGLRETIFDMPISETLAMTMLGGLVISTALLTWLLVSAQTNINRYWQSALFEKSPSSARIGIGEALFALAGIWFWYDTIKMAISESYRASW